MVNCILSIELENKAMWLLDSYIISNFLFKKLCLNFASLDNFPGF